MLVVILKKYIILSFILYLSFFMMRKIIENIKPISEFYKMRSVLYGVKNWESNILKNIYTEVVSLIEVLSIVLFYMLISLVINMDSIIEPFVIFIIYMSIIMPAQVKCTLIYTNYPSSLFLLNIIIYIFMMLVGFFVLFISEIHLV